MALRLNLFELEFISGNKLRCKELKIFKLATRFMDCKHVSTQPRVVLAEQHQLPLLHGLDGIIGTALGHVKGPEDRSVEHHL